MGSDTYRTIAGPAHVDVPKIKQSQFIGDAFPARSVSEAEEHISDVHAREPDATHHCWAYRLGIGGDTFRCSDDGEPGGTAGRPILQQIEGRSITNIVVVVTRFYGGTKLGAGGLARAYSGAAAAVMDAASVVENVVRRSFAITFTYDDTSAVEQLLHRFDIEMLDATYTDVTRLEVGVPRGDADRFIGAFTDALAGRGKITALDASG